MIKSNVGFVCLCFFAQNIPFRSVVAKIAGGGKIKSQAARTHLLCSAERIFSARALLECVDGHVHVENNVRSVGNLYPSLKVDALLLEHGELVEERGEMDHAPVADYAGRGFVQNARGNQVEGVLFAIDDDRVSGVRSAVATSDDIVSRSKRVHKLSLSFLDIFSPRPQTTNPQPDQ